MVKRTAIGFILSLTITSAIGCRPDITGAPAEQAPAASVSTLANAWTRKTPMPSARYFPAVTLVKTPSGKPLIFVMGGSSASPMSVIAYDPVANTWTNRAPMPDNRTGTDGAVFLNGKIYVFGGYSGDGSSGPISPTLVYTVATDTWQTLSINGLSASGAVGLIAGQVYVLNGTEGGGLTTSALHRYDPATDGWTRLTEDPIQQNFPGYGVINGKLYVAGGMNDGGGVQGFLNVYDPATDAWTAKAPMPTASAVAGSTVINGKLYVFGGVNNVVSDTLTSWTTLSTTQIYDPTTDTWEYGVPLLNTRQGLAAAAAQNTGGESFAFLVGGAAPFANGAPALRNNEKFDPSAPN